MKLVTCSLFTLHNVILVMKN